MDADAVAASFYFYCIAYTCSYFGLYPFMRLEKDCLSVSEERHCNNGSIEAIYSFAIRSFTF